MMDKECWESGRRGDNHKWRCLKSLKFLGLGLFEELHNTTNEINYSKLTQDSIIGNFWTLPASAQLAFRFRFWQAATSGHPKANDMSPGFLGLSPYRVWYAKFSPWKHLHKLGRMNESEKQMNVIKGQERLRTRQCLKRNRCSRHPNWNRSLIS